MDGLTVAFAFFCKLTMCAAIHSFSAVYRESDFDWALASMLTVFYAFQRYSKEVGPKPASFEESHTKSVGMIAGG